MVFEKKKKKKRNGIGKDRRSITEIDFLESKEVQSPFVSALDIQRT